MVIQNIALPLIQQTTNTMKKIINIEKLNYAQYHISTLINGTRYSTTITGADLIDEYRGSDNWPDSEEREERAAEKLYDIIWKSNAGNEDF